MLLGRLAVVAMTLSRVSSLCRTPLSAAPLSGEVLQSSDQYQFLDCGDFMRLERFGSLLVSRSCPSAPGRRNPAAPWTRSDLSYEGRSGAAGVWRGEVAGGDWGVRIGER